MSPSLTPPLKPGRVSARIVPSFLYHLVPNATLSAGFCQSYSTSTLVIARRTGRIKAAGAYSTIWDGKLDDGSANTPPGNYTIKVQANNTTDFLYSNGIRLYIGGMKTPGCARFYVSVAAFASAATILITCHFRAQPFKHLEQPAGDGHTLGKPSFITYEY